MDLGGIAEGILLVTKARNGLKTNGGGEKITVKITVVDSQNNRLIGSCNKANENC